MKDIIKKFRGKLNGDGVVGIFSKTCDPGFIEVLGYAGADYVIIDLERPQQCAECSEFDTRCADCRHYADSARKGKLCVRYG